MNNRGLTKNTILNKIVNFKNYNTNQFEISI